MTRGRKNPLSQGLSLRARTAREATGLTLRELADMAGIANSVVHYTEGGRVPRLDTVERIAIVLGVSPCWLAFGEDGTEPFRQKVPRPEGSRRHLTLRSFEAQEDALGSPGVGERLRAAREQAGVSRRQLGEAAQSSGTSILNIEDGRVVPRVDMVERLALALGVAPCWLAFGGGSV